jgi:DNA primase
MKNVVAASGTALTPEQVRLIERYTKNIAMAFDADKAGINAAKRGIDVALKEGMNVRVIQIPEGAGKDADEVLKKNPIVWFKAVEDATEIMQWFFNIVFAGRKLVSPKDQQAVSDELLPLIGLIPYAVEKDFWLKKLAEAIGTEVAVLREDLKRIMAEQTKRSFSSVEEKTVPAVKQSVKLTHLDSLLERLLMVVIKFPDVFPGIVTSLPDLLTIELDQAKLYETIKKQYNTGNDFTAATLLAVLALPEFFELVEILKLKSELEFSEWNPEKARKELVEIIERLKEEDKKARRQILQQEINIAEKAGDQTKVEELLAQFQNL